MLYWAFVFLVIALVAGLLGFGGIASTAAGIAQVLFFIFLVIICFCISSTDELAIDSNCNVTILLCRHTESNSVGRFPCHNVRQLTCSPWFIVCKQKAITWSVGIDHESEWNNVP